MADELVAEVFPLIWSHDVAAISDWAVSALGFVESWRATGDSGEVEHAEVHGFNGKISINIDRGDKMGPSGISLRVDDVEQVKAIYHSAVAVGANVPQGPEESLVAFSFTAIDPDGNQWWVNAETGFLDQLRESSAKS